MKAIYEDDDFEFSVLQYKGKIYLLVIDPCFWESPRNMSSVPSDYLHWGLVFL